MRPRLLLLLLVFGLGACQLMTPSDLPPTGTPLPVPSETAVAVAPTQPPPTEAPTSPDPEASPPPTTAPASPQPGEGLPPAPAPNLFEVAWDDRTPFAAGLTPDAQAVLGSLEHASVYHIEITLANDLLGLQARQEVHYTNAEERPFTEIHFRLFSNLLGGQSTVTDLTVNGQPVTPDYQLQQSDMVVPLPQPLQPGESVVVGMGFAVEIPDESGSNYGSFAFLDQVLALAHFYPMIPVYDDQGWNVEIAPAAGDVVYADSSFYLVRVTMPAGFVPVASGVEIAREASGDQQTITFAAGPMRDFYFVGSEDYEVVSQTVGPITVNSYAPSGMDEHATNVLEWAVASLESFNTIVGPYPFTELDLAGTPNLALGIEYPGIVVLTLRLYDDGPNANGPPLAAILESTVAHEVGHQWFYSLVGNDQLDAPWLDESLTQYITLRYHEDQYGSSGAEGFRQSLDGRWARTERESIPIGLPVREYSEQEYSAIVYGRGPLFFEALSEEMGRERFDAFLQDYYRTFQWGIATRDGLKQLAEQHCACDLTELFQEWVD